MIPLSRSHHFRNFSRGLINFVYLLFFKEPLSFVYFSKGHFKKHICVFQAKELCFVFFKESYKFCIIFVLLKLLLCLCLHN